MSVRVINVLLLKSNGVHIVVASIVAASLFEMLVSVFQL